VRIIAASNIPLQDLIARGKMRKDFLLANQCAFDPLIASAKGAAFSSTTFRISGFTPINFGCLISPLTSRTFFLPT
jgi:hypothetical protein